MRPPPSHAAAPETAVEATAELAQAFPQFEILELLGRGGMASVYKARQRSLDRLVALKVIRPDAQDDKRFADRFVREARALAQMNHPHIVTVHDFGQTQGLYYLVMEFVDGVNLRQMLRAARLEPKQALELVPVICDALQYAHDHGVVHRDIKPENILVDKTGRVKIADFGLAKLLNQESEGASLTQTNHVMGTMNYMAPEQWERPLEVDHRADIYSLGVVIYEMLTGELPVGRFPLPSQKVQIDVRLDEIVLHTLEKEPSLRYQRVSDLKTDVQSVSHPASPAWREHARPTPWSPAPSAGPQGLAAKPPPKPKPIDFDRTIELPGFLPSTIYLLLSMPLSTFYFVFLVTGISLGLGTLVIWIGLFILYGVLAISRGLAGFEIALARGLLGVPLRPVTREEGQGLFDSARSLVKSGLAWRSIGYLILKFPMGLVTFVVTVSLLSMSLSLTLAPLLYRIPWASLQIGSWRMDNPAKALIGCAVGLVLCYISYYTIRGMAWAHAWWARIMLGR
jgi:serine/threonine protein kinase